MNTTFIVGIVGSIILVIGAALPSKTVSNPVRLPKNWFFVFGNISMFTYSYLNFLAGGSIFFIFLQILIAVSTLLMMLNTPDKYDTPILGLAGVALVIWALKLFEGYGPILFVAGLVTLGVGFAMDTGTVRRDFALATGSAVIAIFSYIVKDWIFFWLNVFFALFSAYYAIKLSGAKKDINKPKPA